MSAVSSFGWSSAPDFRLFQEQHQNPGPILLPCWRCQQTHHSPVSLCEALLKADIFARMTVTIGSAHNEHPPRMNAISLGKYKVRSHFRPWAVLVRRLGTHRCSPSGSSREITGVCDCQRCISRCLACQRVVHFWNVCPPQATFVKIKGLDPSDDFFLSQKNPTLAACCFILTLLSTCRREELSFNITHPLRRHCARAHWSPWKHWICFYLCFRKQAEQAWSVWRQNCPMMKSCCW